MIWSVPYRRTLLASLCLAHVVGCGGSDFTGTWTGDITRTDQTTQQATTVAETWEVDDEAATLVRVRGTERCNLELDPGCPDGCFTQTIEPGQTCTVEGQTLVIMMGTLNDNSVGTPQSGEATVTWGLTVEGPPLFVDSGELVNED